MRRWVHSGLKEILTQLSGKEDPKVNAFALFPRLENRKAYAYHPATGSDRFTTRPVRWDPSRGLARGGLFQTFAMMEDGARWTKTDRIEGEEWKHPENHIRTPWREGAKSKRRALCLYPNPTSADLSFIWKQKDHWKRPFRVPKLHLALPWHRNLPTNFFQFADLVWSFDLDGLRRTRKEFGSWLAYRFQWETWFKWLDDGPPTYDIGVACDWGSPDRDRPTHKGREWARIWPQASVYTPSNNGRADDLLRATDCRAYFVPSHREDTYPFDIMLAGARGATLIVPETHRMKLLLEKIPQERKVFYRVHDVGVPGRLHWTTEEVATWLKRMFPRSPGSCPRPSAA